MLSWLVRPRVAVPALLVWLLAGAAGAQPSLRALVGQVHQGVVTRVVDGDMIDVRLASGREVRVRLEGIDAPERGAPFSVQARNATRVALFAKTVTVRGTDVDRYRRLVARVIAGTDDASVALIRAGLACHFTRYSSDPVLAAAQQQARAEAKGFWAPGGQRPATCAPTPSATRPLVGQSAAATGAVVFHGNRNSHVYHAPSCPNYHCPNCVVPFTSHEEAQAAGYRPAGDCLK